MILEVEMSTLGNILTKEHHMTCHALILLKTWHYISGLLTYLLTYITIERGQQ